MNPSDVQPSTTTTSGRVDALRSLFEQHSGRSSDSSTLTDGFSPTNNEYKLIINLSTTSMKNKCFFKLVHYS